MILAGGQSTSHCSVLWFCRFSTFSFIFSGHTLLRQPSFMHWLSSQNIQISINRWQLNKPVKQENINSNISHTAADYKEQRSSCLLPSHAKTLLSVGQSHLPYLHGSSDVVEVQTGWPKRNLWLVPQFRSCFISVPVLVKNGHKFPRKLIPRPSLVYFWWPPSSPWQDQCFILQQWCHKALAAWKGGLTTSMWNSTFHLSASQIWVNISRWVISTCSGDSGVLPP